MCRPVVYMAPPDVSTSRAMSNSKVIIGTLLGATLGLLAAVVPGRLARAEKPAPAQKEVPGEPNDPFFAWKKIGKVFVTEKAKSPKAAPMMANSTGLWLPAKGYFVSVNASTKVCDKAQAKKLAPSMK